MQPAGRGPSAMSPDSMGHGTAESVRNRVSQPAGANGISTGGEHKARYGDDAGWPNIVWTIIGILCVCGLAAFPLMQWAATKFSE